MSIKSEVRRRPSGSNCRVGEQTYQSVDITLSRYTNRPFYNYTRLISRDLRSCQARGRSAARTRSVPAAAGPMSTGALGRLGRWGPPCSRRSADYRHVAVWLYGFGPTELGTPSRRLLRPQAGRARKRIHPRSGAAAGGQSTAPPVRSAANSGQRRASPGIRWARVRGPARLGKPTDGRPTAGPRCRGISRCQCSADRGRRESAAVSHAGRQWGGAVGWCCAGVPRGGAGPAAEDVGRCRACRAVGRRPGAA